MVLTVKQIELLKLVASVGAGANLPARRLTGTQRAIASRLQLLGYLSWHRPSHDTGRNLDDWSISITPKGMAES